MGLNSKLNKTLFYIAMALIILMLIIGVTLCNGIPLIKEATAEEIASKCSDIGMGYYKDGDYYEGLATKIVNYIESKEDFKINDLIDINGIGPKRLKEIKRYFR